VIKLLSVALAAIILVFLCEAQGAVSNKLFHINNQYHPYLEVGLGGVKFSGKKKAAITYDFFLPVFPQSDDELFFTDLRIFDTSGSEFEGNAHFGYRRLLLQENGKKNIKQIIGLYASFDRARTDRGSYFNQITVGGEYWLNEWFLGANVYMPIGAKQQLIADGGSYRVYEKGVGGADVEIGHNLTNNIILYLGGVYFDASEDGITSTRGVNGRLEYVFAPASHKRMLGVFDDAKLRFGVRKSNNRGAEGFIELKLRIGFGSCHNPNLSAFESHMVDLVRRDSHIITQKYLENIPQLQTSGLEVEGSANPFNVKDSFRRSSYKSQSQDHKSDDSGKQRSVVKIKGDSSWWDTVRPWIIPVVVVTLISVGGYELYQHWDDVQNFMFRHDVTPPRINTSGGDKTVFQSKQIPDFGDKKVVVLQDLTNDSFKGVSNIQNGMKIDLGNKIDIKPLVDVKQPVVMKEIVKSVPKEPNMFQRARMNLKSNGNLGSLIGNENFHKEDLAGKGGFDYNPNSKLKPLGNTFIGQNLRRVEKI